MMKNFDLKPFTPTDIKIQLTGSIHLDQNNHLHINYILTGDIDNIAIPQFSTQPSRQDNLWENTCFEFFLGQPNNSVYWEFNLSPTGDWNIYHFDNYREGMQPETAFDRLPFSIEQVSDRLNLSLTLDLNPIFPNPSNLEVAITAVVKSLNRNISEKIRENISYWAVSHLGQVPDFHLRNSFTIYLTSQLT